MLGQSVREPNSRLFAISLLLDQLISQVLTSVGAAWRYKPRNGIGLEKLERPLTVYTITASTIPYSHEP